MLAILVLRFASTMPPPLRMSLLPEPPKPLLERTTPELIVMSPLMVFAPEP